MTVLQKAKQIKNKPKARKQFYIKLFNLGKDWLDVETLMSTVGHKDTGEIYQIYEEWLMENLKMTAKLTGNIYSVYVDDQRIATVNEGSILWANGDVQEPWNGAEAEVRQAVKECRDN